MKLVIGLIGEIGGGKTAVSEHLREKYNASQHRFSKILMDILDRLHLPHDRELLQRLGHSLRESLDQDVLVKAFEQDLRKDEAEILVIDGIRYWNEVELLRRFERSILLYVTAPVGLRYERCRARGEKGEAKISFDEFIQNERRETERHIAEIGEKADHRLENSSSLDELLQQIDSIMSQHLLDPAPIRVSSYPCHHKPVRFQPGSVSSLMIYSIPSRLIYIRFQAD